MNVTLKNGFALKTNKFIVIVTVYNASEFILKCIDSVLGQTYKNYDLIVIDDCSIDMTSDIIIDHWDNNFRYHRNRRRISSVVGNIVKATELYPGGGEDIMVIIDGDDWLYSYGVLEYLNEVYQDQDIWLTYGQFTSVSGRLENFCRPVLSIHNYRRHGIWVTSHLKSFKRKLWNRINDKDLKDQNGNYYTSFEDTSYMFPMIEMAGLKHIRFIDKILYVYNDKNPLSTVNNNRERLRMRSIYPIITEIRRKPSYHEISF